MCSPKIPGLHVPTGLATDMDEWARLLRQGIGHSMAVTRSMGGQPVDESQFACEIADLASSHSQWPDGVLQAVALAAGKYLAAIGRHGFAIADLLESREVVISILPLVRAQLEMAGRVGWFLEPADLEGNRILPEARAARHHMDYLASLCFRRYSSSKRRESKTDQKNIKAWRDGVRDQLNTRFPESDTSWSQPGDEVDWLVGGELYASLGTGIDTFRRVALESARGIYDALSDYAHPSLVTIDDLTTVAKTETLREFPWVVHRESIRLQVLASSSLIYRTAVMLASYLGQRLDDLEEWMDEVEASLSLS